MQRLYVILAATILLAGCTTESRYLAQENPSGANYRQTRSNATDFQQANAACWEKGMGMPAPTQSSRRMAYEKCMNQKGWDNPAFQAP